MLPFAVAAGHVAVVKDDHFPKFLAGFQVEAFAFSQYFIAVQCSEKFRNRCVGVFAPEDIPAFVNGREQRKLVEHMGGLQMALASGDTV
ncbi:hypothetical protein D3C71_1151490 [compost metagenome]